jgi:signal transduction histidine kinase/ligand-binding sensor domain-containing protein
MILLSIAARVQAMTEGPIAGYFHTGWTQGDGAPADIRGITQDDDGWLWIAGPGGLVRFDGVRFERVTEIAGHKLHKSNISGLAWIDGTLWVGYQFGGIERFGFRDGTSAYFQEAEGVPKSAVFEFAGGPGGMISAAMSGGLYEWHGQSWIRAWPAAGAPRRSLRRLRRADDGALFIEEPHAHIYRRAAGATAFQQVDSDDEDQTFSLMVGRDRGFWAAGPRYGFLEYDAAAGRFRHGVPTHLTDTASELIFLRDGSTWMVMAQSIQLLVDTKNFRMVDELTRARGLSDGTIRIHFEDREGNLWLGTAGGIDRIRRGKVHPMTLPDDVSTPGVAAGDGGSVWVSSRVDTPLRQYGPDGILRSTSLISAELVMRAADGTIWAANKKRLDRYARGKEESWELPGPEQAQAMAQERDGSLWVSIIGKREIYHLRDNMWETRNARLGYPETTIALLIDDRNRLWQAFTDNRIAVADGDTVVRYTDKDGLRIGNVQSLAVRNGHIWAGGELALMFMHEGRFVTLQGVDGADFLGVSGIVETASGDLWFNGLQGITHIAAAELKRALGGGAARVAFERFDYQDGVVGQSPTVRPLPSLVQGPDGHIWYITSSAVGWIDPAHIVRNALVPPVRLRGLVADGVAFAPAPTTLRLAAHNNNLRIDYTALSLSMPERMSFRYRLAGVDTNWIDAGTRRSAYYTTLKPGSYRFQVQAVNEDGVWNHEGATQDFTIAPTLAQTSWFRALCALTLLALLSLAFRWRLAQLSRQMRLRMNERIDERTRIARALHDTILQSVQGIILHIHVARLELPQENSVRARLDRVLKEADRAYAEGRDQVTALRMSSHGDIEGTICETGERILPDHPHTSFNFTVSGKRPSLREAAAEEVAEIAREAIRNAFQHAGASNIDVALNYGDALLTLTVKDNGKGNAGKIAEGHWGMIGMRERADRIKAKMSVDGGTNPGTCISVVVPARQIYSGRHRWSWRR